MSTAKDAMAEIIVRQPDASAFARYLGVGVLFAAILFGTCALLVTPKGRTAIRFFWDSIIGYAPRR